MTARESSYSLRCSAPACRYARLLIPTLREARELAERHCESGHVVDVYRETVRLVATVRRETA